MIVLDASALIGYLDAGDAHHDAAATLLAGSGDHELGASALTLAEVLVAPARHDRLEVALDVLRDLEVRELGLPAGSPVLLARLRAQTGLRMPDCCVLLSAEAEGAAVASFDDRLRRAAVGRGLRTLD